MPKRGKNREKKERKHDMKKMKNRIFFDMDGVLAIFNLHATIEEVASKGYFSNCKPCQTALLTMEYLFKNTDLDVYVLTAVFDDDHSMQEKRDWLVKYAPYLPEDHILFAIIGKQTKSEVIGEIRDSDILVDDHTPNLRSDRWHGVGVKYHNGINGKGASGGFSGYHVSVQTEPQKLAKQLLGIAMAEGRWSA